MRRRRPTRPTLRHLARAVAAAIEAEREAAAVQLEALPEGLLMTPAEVASALRARPRP